MMRYIHLLLILTISLIAPATLQAQEKESEKGVTMVVGTKHAPPLSFKGPDGKWTGLSIELWKNIATHLGSKTEYREYKSISSLLDAVKNREINVAAAAVTMTATRDETMDFTHTFAPAHLGIAVLPRQGIGLWEAIARIFSWAFFQALLSLIALLLITGFILWIVERKRNANQFGGPSHKGIGAAFWWSAVTMTTVGYGDKAPITPIGRLVALLWMFASVMVISGFTGAIASSLTIGQLQPAITSAAELPYVKVGTLSNSTGANWLTEHVIPFTSYDNSEDGLKALLKGEIEAFVNDELVLRYIIRSKFTDHILIVPNTFDPGFYALAVPLNDPIQKQINIALLKEVSTPEWEMLWRRYMGP